MKWGLKGGVSIDADYRPPGYVLWCCGGVCHQPDTFIKVGCGHTVRLAHYQIPSYQSEARLFIADKNQYQGPENALVLWFSRH